MRSYNPTMSVEISARLEIEPDGKGRVTSIYGELDMRIPPMPPSIESRYAILKLCEVGVRVPAVGKRQSEKIYYLWFNDAELQTVMEEVKVKNERQQSNAVDGESVSQS